MRYLAQPCDECSDPRHTQESTGLLLRQNRGRTPVLINALVSEKSDKSPTHSPTLSRRMPVFS
jgi:hypothetical protein